MKKLAVTLTLALAALTLAACDKGGGGGSAQTPCSGYIRNPTTGQYQDGAGRIVVPSVDCQNSVNGINGFGNNQALFQTIGGQDNCQFIQPAGAWVRTIYNGQLVCISTGYYQQQFAYYGGSSGNYWPSRICQGYECQQYRGCGSGRYPSVNIGLNFAQGSVGFCF